MPEQKRPVVLIFIDWYLPGYKAGGPIRSIANMVERLSGEFDFRIITRDTDYTETEAYPGVQSDQWNSGKHGEQIYYFSAKNLNRKNLRNVIRQLDYQIAYINGIYSWYFSILPLILCRKYRNKKLVIATRGMLAGSAIDVKGGKKKLFLNLARFAGIYKNVVFHCTNSNEEEDVRKQISPQARVHVADNFPALQTIPDQRKSAKKTGVLRIVNIARIAPEKNLDFALHALNSVSGSEIVFDVYGPVYDLNYAERCMNTARQAPKEVSVEFHGALEPEKIPGLLSAYDLLFMPTRGENFGHIIMESLMAGTPVLVSDRTPFTGTGGVTAIPLEEESKMIAALQHFVRMDEKEHQQHIDAALCEARKKNNTSPLKERYCQMFNC